jgi:signal transduction histidine kinase
MSSTPDQRLVNVLLDELKTNGRSGEIRRFRAGETIFSAGDPGDGFYLVNAGRVKISAPVSQDELRLLAVIEAGDFFGEMAVLDDAPRSATATAETDTETLFLGRDQLLDLLQSRPPIALNLIREFSARVRALNQKYVNEILQAERLAVVGRFASAIVHDFKNPLAVISLAAETAGDPGTPAGVRAKAQKQIERQIVRMSDMLNELIDFTRPSDRLRPLEAVNFTDYIGALAEELRQEIAPRNVRLDLACPSCALPVRLHPARFGRLFYNLVNNAVDAMPDGGEISLRIVQDSGVLRIEVKDTGPGIAPQIAQQLFQPFATHGKAHGTGLGLSICRRIAEDHGGRIWADSAPGQGATFTFTLPLVR